MKILVTYILLFSTLSLFAQQKDYFILLKDKSSSSFSLNEPKAFLTEKAISRRSKQNINLTIQDLPVSEQYITEINAITEVRYTSKWLNGVLVRANEEQLSELKSLDFYKDLLWGGDLKASATSSVQFAKKSKFDVIERDDFGIAELQNTMLGIDEMHNQGFLGKGILVGIFDSGFQNSQNLSIFSSLFNNNQLTATWDFVSDETNVVNDHSHGTNVLSVLAAKQPLTLVGVVPEANYALFRTEDVFSETRIEELYWLLAAEKADSLGVDVINSSLGYYTFDNPAQNYNNSDLDGNTALITKAADWAASKGIIVVTSAGNEGGSSWQRITFPADGDSVIAVGAIDLYENYVSFSSTGPTADGRLKPEVSALGRSTAVGRTNNTVGYSNGTSFSSPLVAGLAAGLIQAYPTLSAMKIRELIIKSGTQYDQPDEYVGHGTPNFVRANELAQFEKIVQDSGEQLFIYPNPINNENSLKAIILDPDFVPPLNIRIFDNLGRLIYEKESDELSFSFINEIKNIPSGSYYLAVEAADKSISKRFVKK